MGMYCAQHSAQELRRLSNERGEGKQNQCKRGRGTGEADLALAGQPSRGLAAGGGNPIKNLDYSNGHRVIGQ